MKTFLLFISAVISLNTVNGQFTQNFEGTESSLTSNCWTLTGVQVTSTAPAVITGNGSLYANPTPNETVTREIITPALNITNQNFTVSFNYKLSSSLNGNATRTIEVGLVDVTGNFTSLSIITLDNNSPVTAQNFNLAINLGFTGQRKLAIRLSGSGGDGSVRMILDDISTNASPLYGTGTCNTTPIAVNDTYSGVTGTVITGNVLSNDNEPDNETMTPSIVVTSPDGVVVLNANGSFTFTPAVGFAGNQTTFTYQLEDNGFAPLNSNIATVTINYFINISLPVKLIDFNAKYNKPNAVISWSTVQEKNFSHFILEQSTDGNNYSQVALIFGAGESDTKLNYSYTDNNLAGKKGLVYYRLKSVDIDKVVSYSSIRIIRLDSEILGIMLTTYPNPVVNELKITIPAAWQNKKVVYELFSANGQVATKMEIAGSSQTETMNLSSLKSGLYIVRVSCEGQTAQQKIIKH